MCPETPAPNTTMLAMRILSLDDVRVNEDVAHSMTPSSQAYAPRGILERDYDLGNDMVGRPEQFIPFLTR